MADIIKQDKYALSQSENIEVKYIADEVKINLKLDESMYAANGGKIWGRVFNTTNQVIPYASVSLMDSQYKPIYHTLADNLGQYSIQDIKEDSYILFAKAPGYKLYEIDPIVISLGSNNQINLSLNSDASEQLGVIAGDIFNGIDNKAVYGAVATLFKLEVVNGQTVETLQSVSYTNQYGQYAFRELSKSKYRIKVNALGYMNTSSDSEINTDQQVLGLNITIMPDGNRAYGTISGIIVDSQNVPINDADVILYKIESDNSTTPIAFTKTNSSGSYLFINVPDGNYKIVSNKTQFITINVLNGISNTL